ncbi:DNA-processing protein DprA [Actinocrispum sp. NPDC049592]|uniref:DNA-processing protein DprA n=1 Tax=Actinocrispum sp. NPDC049592 TaxID=3154835 RepID=UPI00343A69E9
MTEDEVRLARAYLLRVAEPPATALTLFVAQHGPVDAAKLVRAGTVPDAVLNETSARRHIDNPAQDLAEGAKAGARLLIPEDEDWPAWALLPLDNAFARGLRWACPPLGLWVRGAASLTDSLERAVSVVGARSATGYGDQVAADLGYGLGTRGMTVVSGAAYGIDGAAHRGALGAEGRTIAILACGIDKNYPVAHAQLLERITKQGLVITEYPPRTTPAKHRFLVRNRLIAAMGAGTVVVEAGRRSGARNTAASAAALGRVLMAIPGPVTSAMSIGCHELIRDGLATLVCSHDDVAETVGLFGDDLAPNRASVSRPTDGLEADALRVHEALTFREGQSAEQIAEASGIPLAKVRAILPALELSDLATRAPTGWHSATSK